jgi:glucan 1,4-alpha-glucosidase
VRPEAVVYETSAPLPSGAVIVGAGWVPPARDAGRRFRRSAVRPVPRILIAAVSAATAALAAGLGAVPAQSATSAPGAPGAMSHFDLARKDCLGTARNTASKVWFTVANGILSDVYYPTVDNTNVESLQFVVTDGATFTDLQTRDMTYSVSALDESGMACRVVSRAKSGRYTLTTDFFTDPGRASVVLRIRFTPSRAAERFGLYARLDATVNGNGGGGAGNGGADDAVTDTSTGSAMPVALDQVTTTNAANRDYATPVYAALRADRAFLAVSNGYAGSASDGLAQLDADHRLATSYDSAMHGNVVSTVQLDVRDGRSTSLALGFGSSQARAVAVAGATVGADADELLQRYQSGWEAYDERLTPPATSSALSAQQRRRLEAAYYLSANVLKASEDKTFPGAVVASLASPWGQAVEAGDPNNTYFGSYREVFARDLYETFTGLVAAGDLATARATVGFLFERQQQPDGSMPRNSLVNGKTAPDSFGVQLDEVAFPILMARTVGLTGNAFYRAHLKRAADFVVAHGPAFGSERWEEQSGYSPSTIAAEIAGLAAAGAIAAQNGDAAGARIYRGTADHYQRMIKTWTVTTNGSLPGGTYFIRLSKGGDPNAAVSYNLGNGGPTADQREVLDAGFLELPRLGILRSDDPDVARSLAVVDQVLRRTTSSGEGFYRYGTSTAGTEDGYGDCNTDDATDCTVQGKPWAGACGAQGQNAGSGHVWPVLAGERAEHHVATGQRSAAVGLWQAIAAMASGIGLIPEQAWENADLPASPFGTQPECASIGFANGKAAGSASPLTWSAAQLVRLSADIRAGRITEQPVDTTQRYIRHTQAGTTITLTGPANNSVVGPTTTVTGTTDPGARVDVTAINVDGTGEATAVTTTAASDGTFSVELPVPPGTASVVGVATAPGGATGFAQVTVVRDVPPGTLVFEATDPSGDDNGSGTYAYPTSDNFKPGAYDLQRFQVFDAGPDSVAFRVQTADLTPTFGSPLGAQLVDVYVGNPAGGTTSTAASFPQRNYAIAGGSAWNRLIEVQGFGQRFVDGTGSTVGSVQIGANAVTRFITFTVSKAALGGTPGSGWSFAVVLTGQDGFSPDQARGFQSTAQDFQFGVCTAAAVAAGNPICAVDPATVPKAMDVVTPSGVSQATELNPLAGPVVIAGVAIP